jgi:chromosome segregation ATPase
VKGLSEGLEGKTWVRLTYWCFQNEEAMVKSHDAQLVQDKANRVGWDLKRAEQEVQRLEAENARINDAIPKLDSRIADYEAQIKSISSRRSSFNSAYGSSYNGQLSMDAHYYAQNNEFNKEGKALADQIAQLKDAKFNARSAKILNERRLGVIKTDFPQGAVNNAAKYQV